MRSDDVEALARRQYPAADVPRILGRLGPFNESVSMNGCYPARARLAVLALSDGNESLIQQWVEQANLDTRDLQLAALASLGTDWESTRAHSAR